MSGSVALLNVEIMTSLVLRETCCSHLSDGSRYWRREKHALIRQATSYVQSDMV